MEKSTGSSVKPKVLVVDDDPTVRAIIRQILRLENCQVIEADDGGSVLPLFKSEAPDVILLDAMLPVITGFDAAAQIRALPSGSRVPILMITAMADEASMGRAYEAGANDYILKPIRVEIFRRRVRNALQNKLLEDALIRGKREWEATFDSVSDLIILANRQGQILRCNRAAAQRFKGGYASLLGQFIEGILPPEAMAAADGSPATVQLQGAYIEFNTYPMQTPDGGAGLVYVGKDITQRYTAEAAVRESEARLRSIFENSPVSLWEEDFSGVKRLVDELLQAGITDLRGYLTANPEALARGMHSIRVLDVNKATLRLYEASTKLNLFDHLDVVLGSLKDDLFLDEVIAVAEGRTEFEGECVNHTLQGRPLNVHLKISVSPGSETTYERVLISVTDMTQLKQIQAQMLAAQKLADLGTLAAGVAHEINSPLQVITGTCESIAARLEMGPLEPEALQRRLDTIKRNGWRCAEIVRALLTYARPPTGKGAPDNLNAIVQDSLLLIEHQISGWAQVKITAELAPDLPLIVCDRNQITQVLINLLSNAGDALPQGGEIVVHTQYQAEHDRVALVVSDNGEGIPEHILPRIFDPFYTTKPLGKGTGLGLSITAGIIRAHSGSINVHSQVGLGTTFTIYLPTLRTLPPQPAAEAMLFTKGRFDDTIIPAAPSAPVLQPERVE